ncbi:CREB3 regulatory factor-like [Centruroides sculpturatus]|uniref:CREB3 regulatory factor-like n=1 Tax=Centruroides sculpturatus TaxID=218467 RepID=UPI000C6DFE02|nr:CREB3 regulatory factor-like [Centruroides sculpturatus]
MNKPRMNSLDLPRYYEMDCFDDPWLIKNMNTMDPFIDSNVENNVFCNCNEYLKYSKMSDDINVPQLPLFLMNEKEFWESSNVLDTDINFYDSHFRDKRYANLSRIEEEYLWGTPMDMDSLKLGEIFQVEESEANQGPTLAQLNSNGEPLFEALSFNDCSEETKLSTNDNFINKSRTDSINDLVTNTSEAKVSVANPNDIFMETVHVKTENKDVCLPNLCSNYSLSSTSNSDANQTNTSACIQPVNTSSLSISNTTKLQQLLDGNLSPKKEPSGLLSLNVSTSESFTSTLTMACHAQNEMTVRQRNNSSTDRSLCSFSSLSNDEGFDSSRDEFCLDDDGSSDIDSGDGDKYGYTSWYPIMESRQKFSDTKKKKRYFWQYNIQSKGPKGPKIALEQSSILNPYILSKASDPVFNMQYHLDGVKHAGKARRGDGNDLTPNPHKLYSIGLELKKLTKVINDLEPTIDQPFNTRPKSRREKNKLASRVCRLKKKAQHEANKLKLYGLQKEHYNLLVLIEEIKPLLKETLEGSKQSSLTQKVEKVLSLHDPTRVAGRTTEFVNGILEKVSEGDPNGGLCDL